MATNSTHVPSKPFDPDYPVPYWHQRMELAIVVTVNTLSLLAILARLHLRAFRLKRFRADDKWMLAAGVFLIFPHFVCQIGANRFGSGLYTENIPDHWRPPFWYFSWGWIGYNIVSSLIKISMCCYLLQIVPFHMQLLRRLLYVLMVITFALGVSISLCHMLQCSPLISNFIYKLKQDDCFDIDIPRFVWIGGSIFIDLCILAIPWAIIRGTRIQAAEKRILLIVFSGNLMGTLVCVEPMEDFGADGFSPEFDLAYTQTAFAITNDVEILFYTLGASLPVLSPFLLSRFAVRQEVGATTTSRVPSWRVKGGSMAGSPVIVRMPTRPPRTLLTWDDATYTRGDEATRNDEHDHDLDHDHDHDHDDGASSDTTLAAHMGGRAADGNVEKSLEIEISQTRGDHMV
ncbi:hypothetical protein Dda_3183 [Drechslerella dactyloides]|uniref:Rhodopsin domain-containing protein n=1 Tax=Drechslerella dactyloides TaxID=74499 RepID=A0AAD6NLJ0_DREDA|nr:hypothetical protein Dda_3183 [Drechslerella dactyloides]